MKQKEINLTKKSKERQSKNETKRLQNVISVQFKKFAFFFL